VRRRSEIVSELLCDMSLWTGQRSQLDLANGLLGSVLDAVPIGARVVVPLVDPQESSEVSGELVPLLGTPLIESDAGTLVAIDARLDPLLVNVDAEQALDMTDP